KQTGVGSIPTVSTGRSPREYLRAAFVSTPGPLGGATEGRGPADKMEHGDTLPPSRDRVGRPTDHARHRRRPLPVLPNRPVGKGPAVGVTGQRWAEAGGAKTHGTPTVE